MIVSSADVIWMGLQYSALSHGNSVKRHRAEGEKLGRWNLWLGARKGACISNYHNSSTGGIKDMAYSSLEEEEFSQIIIFYHFHLFGCHCCSRKSGAICLCSHHKTPSKAIWHKKPQIDSERERSVHYGHSTLVVVLIPLSKQCPRFLQKIVTWNNENVWARPCCGVLHVWPWGLRTKRTCLSYPVRKLLSPPLATTCNHYGSVLLTRHCWKLSTTSSSSSFSARPTYFFCHGWGNLTCC